VVHVDPGVSTVHLAQARESFKTDAAEGSEWCEDVGLTRLSAEHDPDERLLFERPKKGGLGGGGGIRWVGCD